MSIVQSLELGFLVGIALFFVLHRQGVIDQWLQAWER
jgi:hypothetical protein